MGRLPVMPASSTPPSSSLEHVQFTALPGSESSITASVAATTASGAVSGTAGAGSNFLALLLKAFTSLLASTKLLVTLISVLGVIIIGATTLGIVLTQNSQDSASAGRNDSSVKTTAATFGTSSSSSSGVYSSSSTLSSTYFSSSSSSPSTSTTSVTTTSSTASSRDRSTTTTIATTTTIPTTTTPTYPACKETEYRCHSGQCLDVTVLCDGIPNCADGSDEGIPCACSSYQYTCTNGQCIAQDGRCNGIPQCVDKSDEMGCPDCRGFRCTSDDLCLWDSMRHQCDRVFHCSDLSDEMDCPKMYGLWTCNNSVQISKTLWCNGVDDCRDNSDEQNCSKCPFYKVPCVGPGSQCISRSWRCDGFPDCDNGEDEMSCGKCNQDEFQCTDYSCVPISSRCDGKIDCIREEADEQDCFSLDENNIINMMINGTTPLPLCADGWGIQLSSDFCYSHQKQGILQTWTRSVFEAPIYATLRPGSQSILPANFISSTECKSKRVVRVRCKQTECGERQTKTLTSFIAGGDIVPLGKWPWIGSLAYLNKPICGAVIIGRKWLLTAAHCVMRPISGDADFTSVPFYFNVTTGTTTMTPEVKSVHNDPSSIAGTNFQTSQVAKIHLHPKARRQANGGVDWDMALLELDTDLVYSETVHPLCLPPQGKAFLRASVCYLAGWGMLTYSQKLRADKLHESRMILWQEERCQKNIVLGEKEVNVNSTICAGFFYGLPTACQGDSGAPLMCLEAGTQRWILAGIMSSGENLCGQFKPNSLSNRFARVASSTSWILDTMAGG